MTSIFVFANNGVRVVATAFPEVVWLSMPVGCSGTIVGDGRQILTAAHCLTHSALLEKLSPLQIERSGKSFSILLVDVAIHPAYTAYLGENGPALAENNLHDLAILTADQPLILEGIRKIADAVDPSEEMQLVGWGFPLPAGDWDQDGIENNDDHCPYTPFTERENVEPDGQRKGCAPGQIETDLGWALREGKTSIANRTPGRLILRRRIDENESPGNLGSTLTLPAAGDSGGPLLNRQGKVVGVVKGGKTRIFQNHRVHEAYCSDLEDQENVAFLREHLLRL